MNDVETIGTTSSGQEVQRVRLRSATLEVRLLTWGATIESVEAPDRHGRRAAVHLTLADLAAYEDRHRNPYLGATVGRYANRIAGARFPLEGVTVELAANDGPNCLHGGPEGWDRRVWDLLDVGTGTDGGHVVFGLTSPDGDQGFPATVRASARYVLDGASLRIEYRATTDAPTVVNMTSHGYWNLDGSATVADHHLQLAADRVLPVDRAGIPTGGLLDVEDTPFDLRSRIRLGPVIEAVAPGLDHCFAVDGPVGTVRPAALLDAPASGRWMEVRTDQAGVQLYTANGLGAPFGAHASVSLEAQAFPDTPNRPELGSTRLDPGGEYLAVTELRFGAGEVPALGADPASG